MPLPARLLRGGPVFLALVLAACAVPREAPPATVPPVEVTVAGPVPAATLGQALHLVRYEIAPGTRLPAHFHEGTQIGRVEAGILTYHVLTGRVPV